MTPELFRELLTVSVRCEMSVPLHLTDCLLVEEFVQSGLMRREHDRVKLHVTLLNTLFRREQGDLGDTDRKERESFDGRLLLERFSKVGLGQVELTEVHLSQRRAGRRTNAGYYLPSAVLSVNSCN